MIKSPPGKARRPAGPIHPTQHGDDRYGGTSGHAKALWMGVRQPSRSIGAMASRSATTNAHENASGHRQPGEPCAREAGRPGSQGTKTVRGTWCSAGEAGRHLRTKAGHGHGTPSPAPVPLRLERIATQAQQYPDMACTTLAYHLDVAMLERACGSLNPTSAPGVDRVTWPTSKANLETNLVA